jgi:molybdopterin converting factor small subunit
MPTMVTIRLKVFSILREVTGARNLSLPLPGESVVRDFLHALDARYGTAFRRETDRDLYESITAKFNVFLNNKLLVFPEGLDVLLREGDAIVILQPSSGG